MNRRQFLTGSAALVSAAGAPLTHAVAQTQSAPPSSPLPPASADGWSSLFNGRNLDGWYTFLQTSGRNNDPYGCVRVESGMLHIMGNEVTDKDAEPGYVATLAEYSNYRFRLDYKWGSKRFHPRMDWKRDNGLLFHVVGPDRVWPTCMEVQIQESDVGDTIPIGGVRYVIGDVSNALPPWPNPPKANALAMGGPSQPRTRPRYGDFEDRDGWNTVEVIVRDDRAAFLVNGRIVNTVFAMQRPEPPLQAPQGGKPAPPIPPDTRLVPLNRGKIAVEIEYAETWFRNIEIRPLTDRD